MADFGTTGADYSPDVLSTGLIGKIAKQIVEGEDVPYLFSEVDKGEIKTGKDLEVALFKAVEGQTPTGSEPTFAKQVADTRYFKTWIRHVFPVLLDYSDIDDGATDEMNATRQAEKIVDAMYQGGSKAKNADAFKALSDAIDAYDGDPLNSPVVLAGTLPEITDEASARKFLFDVKTIAKKVRRGAPSLNSAGLDVSAPRVIMVTPQKTVTAIDVYTRTDAFQLDYARFDVDYVIEYDADKYGDMNGATVIADERFFQFYEKGRVYKELPVVGADNGETIKAALSTRFAPWLCGLFNAAVIKQGD